MREQATTLYIERRAGPSGWVLAAVVFCCFVTGFALPRLLGGRSKSSPGAEAIAAAVQPTRIPAPVQATATALVQPAAAQAPAAAAMIAPPPIPVAPVADVPRASALQAPALVPAAAATAKSDTASTLYERTLVRQSAPEGEIIARIPMGTEVHIVERLNNWYHVKYGTNKEGWIYRKSIGK